MTWTAWICDTVTGVKRQRIPVSALPWGRMLNAGWTGGTAAVPLTPTAKKIDAWGLTEPVKNTLVLDRDGTVVYAGIIWDQDYDYDHQSIALKHADLWSLFVHRLAADLIAPLVTVTSETYTAVSLSTLAKRLMQLAMNGPAQDNRLLPITLPADIAGTISRTYYGYHLNMLADVLTDLIKEGLDIDFRPRWLNNKLDYEMRVGQPLNEGAFEWNLTAPKHGITDLHYKRSGLNMASNEVATGEGSEQKMLARSNRLLNPTFPAMDRISSYPTVSDVNQLATLSAQDVATFNHLTSQMDFSILASGKPKLTDLLLGGTTRVYSKGDPVIPDGWNVGRIIGFTGDLSENIALSLQ